MAKNLLKLVVYGLAVMVIMPVTAFFNNSKDKDVKIKSPVGATGMKMAMADTGSDSGDDGSDCDDGDDGDC